MTINERISAYLSQKGLTPQAAGFTPDQMQPGAEIDPITYHKACKFLQVSLDYFLREEAEQ